MTTAVVILKGCGSLRINNYCFESIVLGMTADFFDEPLAITKPCQADCKDHIRGKPESWFSCAVRLGGEIKHLFGPLVWGVFKLCIFFLPEVGLHK